MIGSNPGEDSEDFIEESVTEEKVPSKNNRVNDSK